MIVGYGTSRGWWAMGLEDNCESWDLCMVVGYGASRG